MHERPKRVHLVKLILEPPQECSNLRIVAQHVAIHHFLSDLGLRQQLGVGRIEMGGDCAPHLSHNSTTTFSKVLQCFRNVLRPHIPPIHQLAS